MNLATILRVILAYLMVLISGYALVFHNQDHDMGGTTMLGYGLAFGLACIMAAILLREKP